MQMQIAPLQPFRLSGYPDEVTQLFLAAKSALIWQHAQLFSLQMSLRDGDGRGGLKPFDAAALSDDDRKWVAEHQDRVDKLAAALEPFGYKL